MFTKRNKREKEISNTASIRAEYPYLALTGSCLKRNVKCHATRQM